MWGWGDGDKGCLGFGDGRNRLTPTPISFFENKRVIDVPCGDRFPVVTAEVEGDPLEWQKKDFSEDGLLKKTNKFTLNKAFTLNPNQKNDNLLKSVR